MTTPIARLVAVSTLGRHGRVRSVLIAAAGVVSALLLLAVVSAPSLVAREQARAADQVPIAGQPTSSAGIGFEEIDSHYRTALVKRILVAKLRAPGPTPPGIAAVPAVGDAYVSPELLKRMRRDPVLAGWFPYRVAGVIAQAGLINPHQLLAYIGVQPGELAADQVAVGFGDAFVQDSSASGARWYQTAGFAILVVAPALVSFLAIGRIGAEVRRRRDRSLHMLGLSRTVVSLVGGCEAAIPSILGTIAAVGLFYTCKQFIHQVPIVHRAISPADLAPNSLVVASVVIGLIAISTAVGVGSSARSTKLRRGSRPIEAPQSLALLPLGLFVLGVAMLVWQCLYPQPRAQMLRIGLVLTALGLPLASMHGGRTAARIVRSSWPLPMLLALRRIIRAPGPAGGLMSVVTVLAFAVTCCIPVVRTFNDSPSWSSLVGSSILVRVEPLAPRMPFEPSLPPPQSTTIALDALGLWNAGAPAASPPIGRALVASCAQLDELEAQPVAGCRDGIVMSVSTTTDDSDLAAAIQIRSADGNAGIAIPAAEQAVALPSAGSVPVDVGYIIPPSMPQLASIRDPFVTAVYARLPARAADVDLFQSWAAGGGPGHVLDVPAQESVATSNTSAWILLAILICGLLSLLSAFAIALTRSRSPTRPLRVIGAPRWIMSAAATITSAAMAVVGGTISVVCGLLAGIAFVRVLQQPLPPLSSYVAIWGGAIVCGIVLGLAADAIRRDV